MTRGGGWCKTVELESGSADSTKECDGMSIVQDRKKCICIRILISEVLIKGRPMTMKTIK